jgi:hypothetical protein
MKFQFLIVFLLLAFAACKSKQKNTYAIRDFRESVQVDLIKAATSGITHKFGEGVTFQNEVRDDELLKLLKSEHAKLRALAFEEIVSRGTEDYLSLLKKQLNDTGFLIIDEGEWGYKYTNVADHILGEMKWRTEAEKQEMINEVVLKHGYLESAYKILPDISLKEEYYNAIKGMVLSYRYLPDENMYGGSYETFECALYALATYQKNQDTTIINELLSQNVFDFNRWSSELISKYPSEFHFSLLEKYYKDYFYQNYKLNEIIWAKCSFVHAVASYKIKRSAEILDEILSRNPTLPCPQYSTLEIDENLSYAILNNPCKEYERLMANNVVKETARRKQDHPKRHDYKRIKDLERW